MREWPNQKVNCCGQAHLPGEYRLIAEPLPSPQDLGKRGDHLGITPSSFSKVEHPMTRQHLTIVDVVVSQLRPYPKNARTHSKKQIRQIADSITRFGFTNPVLISDDNEIIAGHGRVEAAKLVGRKNVPTVRLSHLDAAQRRAYVLADNKLALNAGWDCEVLAIELQALIDLDFGAEITGFSLAEIDLLLDEARESSPDPRHEADDEVPPFTDPRLATTRPGDLWQLGRHRLLCGDARHRQGFDCLLDGACADLVSPTRPTTLRSTDMCAGLAVSATASSPWGPARCRGRPSRASCG